MRQLSIPKIVSKLRIDARQMEKISNGLRGECDYRRTTVCQKAKWMTKLREEINKIYDGIHEKCSPLCSACFDLIHEWSHQKDPEASLLRY